MLEELKNTVFKANLRLKESGLVILTWGNASQIDRESGLVVIKPSGIPYDAMTPNDMVTVDLNGNVVDGKRRPSSDLYTHLEIYKQFDNIGGITLLIQGGQPCLRRPGRLYRCLALLMPIHFTVIFPAQEG